MTTLKTIQTKLEQIQVVVNKQDHPFWKHLGNQAIYILAPIGTLLITLFVPDPYKAPALAVWNSLCIAFKGGTKFTSLNK
jgi:hypothetical protein